MFKKAWKLIKEIYEDILLVVKSHLCKHRFKKEVGELFNQIQENGSHKARIDASIVQSHLQYLDSVSYDPLDFLIEVDDWLNDRVLDTDVTEDLIMVAIMVLFEKTTEKYGVDSYFRE